MEPRIPEIGCGFERGGARSPLPSRTVLAIIGIDRLGGQGLALDGPGAAATGHGRQARELVFDRRARLRNAWA